MKKELASKIFLLGLVSVLLMSVVSAETVWDNFWNSGSGVFGGIGNFITHPGNFGGNQIAEGIAAQWLLFFLVVLIVYAVSSAIPFLGKDRSWGIRGAVSVVIGILAIFFLKPEEILTILQTYKTLGIALTVIVPFFVIAAVSKDLHDNQHGTLAKFIWILFLGTLIVRYATAPVEEIGEFGKWAFWVTLIGTLFMIIWENRVYIFLFKQQIKEARDSAGEEHLAEITAQLEQLAEEITNAQSDAVKRPLVQKYNRKVQRQNELGGNYKPWGSI